MSATVSLIRSVLDYDSESNHNFHFLVTFTQTARPFRGDRVDPPQPAEFEWTKIELRIGAPGAKTEWLDVTKYDLFSEWIAAIWNTDDVQERLDLEWSGYA